MDPLGKGLAQILLDMSGGRGPRQPGGRRSTPPMRNGVRADWWRQLWALGRRLQPHAEGVLAAI